MLSINFAKIKVLSYFMLLVIATCIILFYFYKKNSIQTVNNIPTNKTVQDDESINTTTESGIKTFKIVAFGDSFTSGSYVEAKDNYPSILENILNKNPKMRFKVINMGIPGETSAGGLDRIDSILEQKSDLVLLELGGNDMEQNIDVNIAKNNLDTILKKFKDNNQKVIILGLDTVDYYGLEYKNNFDAVFLDLSKKYNLLLVPSFLAGVRKVEKYNTADGEHPNKAGYEKIVLENIMPILEKYLSKNI